MSRSKHQVVELLDFSTFLDQCRIADDNLDELLAKAAGLLNVETCSIMLFRDEEKSGDFRLRIFAKVGDLPRQAFSEAVKVNDGIAGRVAATGEAMLVEDISKTDLLPLARRPDHPSKSFICVPIVIGGRVVGVINISNPRDGRRFSGNDLKLAMFVALLTGKSLQVVQLKNVLESRYAQLSLASSAGRAIEDALPAVSYDPAKTVKILAKTFYKEMVKIGMGNQEIVIAATEIISLLNQRLARHRRRQHT